MVVIVQTFLVVLVTFKMMSTTKVCISVFHDYDIRSKPKEFSSPTFEWFTSYWQFCHVQMPCRQYSSDGSSTRSRVRGKGSICNEECCQQVSLLISLKLVERVPDFNIIWDNVFLTELSFGKEYTATVENKQAAQQKVQKIALSVWQARQERQQIILHAKGKGEAAKMLTVVSEEMHGP